MKPVPEGSTREYEELKRWAKQTDLAEPLPWADLEARVLSEQVPPHAELVALLRPPGPASRVLTGALVLLLVGPLAAVTVLAPWTGLAFVAAHVVLDRDLLGGGSDLLALLYWVAIAVPFIPAASWLGERRRSMFAVTLTLGTALAAAAAWWLLGSAEPYQRIGVWESLQSQAAIAVVTGSLGTLFVLVVARPSPGPTLREQLRRSTLEDRWLQEMRAGLLEELVKRDLVSQADVSGLMRLPRGTWSELESLPDGRVVRHRP